MVDARENGGRESLVAVAVDRDKSSRRALKWTVENFVTRGQTVRLVHVIPRPPVGTDESVAARQLKIDLFLPLRCFCMRRQIKCEQVMLEDPDVARALIEYVTQCGIGTLLLGAASKTGLSRLFKATDIPASVLKWAPDFCNVYVISKGKVAAVRSATRPVPIIGGDRFPAQHGTQNLNNEAPSVISLSGENDGLSYDELAALDSDMLSPGSDYSFRSFYENLGSTHNQQHNVEPCRRSEFSAAEATPCSFECAEGEIRRLKIELKQTMDMYHAACREALAVKKKVMELQEWKKKEEKRMRETHLEQESPSSAVEKEKARLLAAFEATEAAQKYVELEVQRRLEAERKALREAEERERLLHALGQSHTVVKYQSLFHILAVLFLFYFYFSL